MSVSSDSTFATAVGDVLPWPAELGRSPETALPSTVRHGRYSKRSVLVLRLEINRSGGNDVFGDRAENVERSRIGFGCFAFGGFNYNGNAGGKMIAEPTAVAVNTEVLCNPAIGNDKSEAEIEVRSVPAFAPPRSKRSAPGSAPAKSNVPCRGSDPTCQDRECWT